MPSSRSGRLLSVVEDPIDEATKPSSRVAPTIRSLGGFEVLRNGNPVVPAEWQSKKSRDLLKLLVARRGKPIHRESIIDILWPGMGSPGADNRLSVALSRARTILDPRKQLPPDHYIRGSEDALWLHVQALDIDVLQFLELATTGLRALRGGDADQAADTLRRAFDLYGGDFLEDQLYDQWTMPIREEARAAFIGVALALGKVAGDQGAYESAVSYYMRVIELDQYAEEALLGLVRSAQRVGRHGEVQRHYLIYINRMTELGIEPVPRRTALAT